MTGPGAAVIQDRGISRSLRAIGSMRRLGA